jgi:hypothetical protein
VNAAGVGGAGYGTDGRCRPERPVAISRSWHEQRTLKAERDAPRARVEVVRNSLDQLGPAITFNGGGALLAVERAHPKLPPAQSAGGSQAVVFG